MRTKALAQCHESIYSMIVLNMIAGIVAVNAGGSRPGEGKEGARCSLFWPMDDEWYTASVHEHDAATGRHRIVYELDDQVRSLRLCHRDGYSHRTNS